MVLAFIAFGAAYINRANWEPFIPAMVSEGHFGWSGIVRAAGVIFFAYIGFDAVSTAAQETKNPQRDMPIGILGSLVICTVLYIAVSLVLTGIVSYTQLNVPDPIAVGINAAGPGLAWLRPFVKIGAIAGLSSVILVMLHGPAAHLLHDGEGRAAAAGLQRGAPEVQDAVARHHHDRCAWPWSAPACCRSACSANSSPSGRCWPSRSSAAACWCCATPIPNIPRPFSTPLVPFVPVAGVLSCVYLMVALPRDTWARLIVWMAIGLAIYVLYGRKHSRLNK